MNHEKIIIEILGRLNRSKLQGGGLVRFNLMEEYGKEFYQDIEKELKNRNFVEFRGGADNRIDWDGVNHKILIITQSGGIHLIEYARKLEEQKEKAEEKAFRNFTIKNQNRIYIATACSGTIIGLAFLYDIITNIQIQIGIFFIIAFLVSFLIFKIIKHSD